MKIRAGFVTNSSSSSFVAVGLSMYDLIDKYTDDTYCLIYDLYQKHNNKLTDFQSAVDSAATTVEEKINFVKEQMENEQTIETILDNIKNDHNVRLSGESYDIVGISTYQFLKGEEFKDIKTNDIYDKVAELINVVFKTKINSKDLDYFDESWYDG